MAIELIKVNTARAISHCEELLEELSNVDSLRHSLEYIVNTDIPNIWTSDTADINSISNGLKENVVFLENFIKFSKEFSITLQDYATSLKAIGNEGTGSVGDGTTSGNTTVAGENSESTDLYGTMLSDINSGSTTYEEGKIPNKEIESYVDDRIDSSKKDFVSIVDNFEGNFAAYQRQSQIPSQVTLEDYLNSEAGAKWNEYISQDSESNYNSILSNPEAMFSDYLTKRYNGTTTSYQKYLKELNTDVSTYLINQNFSINLQNVTTAEQLS